MGTRAVGQWEFSGTDNPMGTMRRMIALIRKDATTVDAITAANSIVMTADGHNEYAMANEIKEWAQNHLHYIPDLNEMQVLKSPLFLLHEAQTKGVFIGNCADAAMLCAMLCICDGIPCSIEARAFIKPNAPYQHVVCVTDLGRPPEVDFDITRPIGSPDVVVSRRYRMKV